MDPIELCRRLDGLVVFRGLLEDEAVAAFREMAGFCRPGQADALIPRAAAFEAVLFRRGADWSRCLETAALECETACVRCPPPLPELMERALGQELQFLDRLAQIRWEDLTAQMPDAPGFLPGWTVSPVSIASGCRRRMAEAGTRGYGAFARHHVFTVEAGRLVPVRHPDPRRLSELPGYEREREQVIANTLALLEGRPASNVLLYGDAGTGKSSTVKAIANEYAGRGLRLVEVKKNQLYQLPDLMDSLAENPLKFILFIDDLSFTANDDDFAALKAILEGSAGGRAGNLAVYATSNRRHLVKETLSDRSGDDIHERDTRQELMSLAARFGLTVTFGSPDRERYLRIVRELAAQYGLEWDETELAVRAEAFALRMGGRSARVARQFAELCAAGVQAVP